MGVKSAHKFLRKMKVLTQQMEWNAFIETNHTTIYVDLMATCFQLIRTNMSHGKSSDLIRILTSIFRHRNVIVVFDGERSNEKGLARVKRNHQIEENIRKHEKVELN